MHLNVLVTGSTGFVGSHALKALQNATDVNVIAGCRDPSKLPQELKPTARIGDLRDAEYLRQITQDIDILVHAAAWTSLYGHKKESDELYLRPSMNLINQALASGVKKFVYISSNSAAAPEHSHDANSPGIPRPFWPHLSNVIKIENHLRELANEFESVINLRLGLFVGQRYNLGLLPILLPRLKTHLVPWVNGGKTDMPLIDGRDIGQAVQLACTNKSLTGFESFNVLGPSTPSVREAIEYLQQKHNYPKPHFGVPFALAYPFAWLMEAIDPLVPWEPLVTRSIIHLLEETNTNNEKAAKLLGYQPQHDWKDAIDAQIAEMQSRQTKAMKMHVKVT